MSSPGVDSPKIRVYRLLCAVGAVLSLAVVIPSNLFQNLSPWINLPIALFGLASGALYLGARRNHYFPLTFALGLIAVLNATWFLNGGSQGSVLLYFPAALLTLIVFFRGTARWVTTAFLVVDVLGLLLLERLFPQWVIPFASPQERFWDLMTGTPISIAACLLIGWVVVDSYHREHARLAEINDRLSKSLAEIKTLQGLLPVCSWCKKIGPPSLLVGRFRA